MKIIEDRVTETRTFVRTVRLENAQEMHVLMYGHEWWTLIPTRIRHSWGGDEDADIVDVWMTVKDNPTNIKREFALHSGAVETGVPLAPKWIRDFVREGRARAEAEQ